MEHPVRRFEQVEPLQQLAGLGRPGRQVEQLADQHQVLGAGQVLIDGRSQRLGLAEAFGQPRGFDG